MKNKLIMLALAVMIGLAGLTACSSETNATPMLNMGKDSLIEIGDCVYYDSYTGVVYWWNGYMKTGHSNTSPTPYYSPNGYLYRYIPETNTLEEILPINPYSGDEKQS